VRLSVLTLGILLAAAPVKAMSLDLNYTIYGAGGLSAPIDGVSDSGFWWIDTTGHEPTTSLASFGFEPFPAFDYMIDTLNRGGGGSIMVSSEFTLGANETLTVDYRMLSGFNLWQDSTAPTGVALLISDNAAPIVLANINADGTAVFKNQNFNPPVTAADSTFVPVSDGVSMTAVRGSGLDVTLNGLQYVFPDNIIGLCGCYLDVTSSVTPGSGNYHLVFATYDYEFGRNFYNAALAVTSIETVPEPSEALLMALGIVTAIVWRVRSHSTSWR
jgi:hypothetical protein